MESTEGPPALPESLLSQVAAYLDLLLRWNARTNLTAIREPQEIVTRHFGESFFAARQIVPAGKSPQTLADVGSGAGFPGLAIKLWAPQLEVTLIESHQKKATFLREVVRSLNLTGIEVVAKRAETVDRTFDIVTLRAVEHFGEALLSSDKLLNPAGSFVLLIGEDQAAPARAALPALKWDDTVIIPNSQRRVVLIGTSRQESR
jgi:16S rRNA (guanine527-N7)-methyltransferase